MFTPGPSDENFLLKYGLNERKIILTVARLSKAERYKGHERIIQALPRIRPFEPSTIYVIVGDGDYRSSLEAEATRLGVSDVVRFLGRLSDPDTLKLYRAASVFAMPSTKEGFGIVFVEAAATGLPVIGGNLDGSVDALADGFIGMSVDPDDTDALKKSLLARLNANIRLNPDEAQRFAFDNFARHVDDLVRTLAH